ncbi:hypothetical protein, partial [Streptomyces goshikiensis]|uniref:hypothetical protein n=1 Tax=Streptomyces goshikiensis TaxID=1942 RepID=UPI0036D41B99
MQSRRGGGLDRAAQRVPLGGVPGERARTVVERPDPDGRPGPGRQGAARLAAGLGGGARREERVQPVIQQPQQPVISRGVGKLLHLQKAAGVEIR